MSSDQNVGVCNRYILWNKIWTSIDINRRSRVLGEYFIVDEKNQIAVKIMCVQYSAVFSAENINYEMDLMAAAMIWTEAANVPIFSGDPPTFYATHLVLWSVGT